MLLLEWLRQTCDSYSVEPVAVYRKRGSHPWPLVANNEQDLLDKLQAGGHFLPLPREPAALANVLEVPLVDFLLRKLGEIADVEGVRGTERGYPDIEVSGRIFGSKHYAVDVKVARRRKNREQTDSRITLYTGNTYFRYPQLRWPGTFRPFDHYAQHIDVIVLYTLNEITASRVDDLEIVVQEPWRIGSKKRSSTTREYLGAVTSIAALRAGEGDFDSEQEFYRFWRRFPFKIGRAVQLQLDKLLREQHAQKHVQGHHARSSQKSQSDRRRKPTRSKKQ